MEVKPEMNDLKITTPANFDNKGGSVLGILEGPVADFLHPTRNERLYSDEVWENVWKDPLVKEMFKNGGIVGELDHPVDREEIDSTRIAIKMPEPPVKGKDGLYRGRFEILNTPCGQIVYTLAKAGFKVGISSRGNGDVEQNFDGSSEVIPDSYSFKCFDVVLLPSVEKARMNLITESLNKKSFNYKKALNEALNNASDEDRKLMEEVLTHLDVNIKEDCKLEKVDDKEAEEETLKENDEKADDIRLTELIKNFQETVKKNAELENYVPELQKELAVSNTKVMKLTEELNKYKQALTQLSSKASANKKLQKNIETLTEELNTQKNVVAEKEKTIKKLSNEKLSVAKNSKILSESLLNKDEELRNLKEMLAKRDIDNKKAIEQLNEDFDEFKLNSKIQLDESNKKLNQAYNNIRKYKSVINETLSRYIRSKAVMLGVSENRIKNELAENYSIDDIDKVCTQLREDYVNISKLPFNITSNTRGRVTESVNDNLAVETGIDDEIDDSLLELANLKRN